ALMWTRAVFADARLSAPAPGAPAAPVPGGVTGGARNGAGRPPPPPVPATPPSATAAPPPAGGGSGNGAGLIQQVGLGSQVSYAPPFLTSPGPAPGAPPNVIVSGLLSYALVYRTA